MGKRIVILAFGTRGDVQPFIPLALGLMNRGYAVLIGASLEISQKLSSEKSIEQAIVFIEAYLS